MGVFLIVAGIAGIAAGIFGKNFYAEGQSEWRVPTWFGRLIFLLVGVVFIGWGIALLVKAG
jgi:uncharacterized membrane protein YczE